MASIQMNMEGLDDIYTIVVNNPGSEFNPYTFNVVPDAANGELTISAIEDAVQAFADSVVASNPNFSLRSIVKTTHSSTTL